MAGECRRVADVSGASMYFGGGPDLDGESAQCLRQRIGGVRMISSPEVAAASYYDEVLSQEGGCHSGSQQQPLLEAPPECMTIYSVLVVAVPTVMRLYFLSV